MNNSNNNSMNNSNPRNLDSILNRSPSSNTTPSIRFRTANSTPNQPHHQNQQQQSQQQQQINLKISNFNPKGSPLISPLLEVGISVSHWHQKSTSPLPSPILSCPSTSTILTPEGRARWSEFFSPTFQAPYSDAPLSSKEERLLVTGQYSYQQYHVFPGRQHSAGNTNPSYQQRGAPPRKFVSKSNSNNNSNFEAQFDSRNDETFGDIGGGGGGGGSLSTGGGALGEMSFGSFDSKGSFKLPGQTEMKPFVKLTSFDFEDSSTGPAAAVSAAVSTAASSFSHQGSGTPIYYQQQQQRQTMTMWFYRDPHGQIQGPFSDDQMMNWYEKDYFPDSLPLRRAQDSVYYSLSVWKSRSLPFSGSPFHHDSGIGSWTLQDVPAVPEQTVATAPAALSKQAAATVEPSERIKEATTTPTTTLREEGAKASLGMEQLAFLSKFKKQEEPACVVSANPTIVSKTAPSKTAEQHSSTTVNNVQKLFEQFMVKEEMIPSPSPVPAPAQTQIPAPFISQSTNAWNASKGSSSGSTKKTPIDFATLLHQEEKVLQAKRGEELQRKKKTHSFADLMKQGTSTATTATAATADNTNIRSSSPVISTTQSKIVQQKPEDPIKEWCLEKLRPLSTAVDVNLCTSLLMAMSGPQEIVSFLEDNLRIPSNRCSFDLDSFSKELCSKKLGAIGVNGGTQKAQGGNDDMDGFQTVTAKRR